MTFQLPNSPPGHAPAAQEQVWVWLVLLCLLWDSPRWVCCFKSPKLQVGGRVSRFGGRRGHRGSRSSPQRLLVPTGHRCPARAWPRAAQQEGAPEHEAIPADTTVNKCSLSRRSAVEEGKGIFHNIKNFVRFQLST